MRARTIAMALMAMGISLPVVFLDIALGVFGYVRGSGSLTDIILFRAPLWSLFAVLANALPFAVLAALSRAGKSAGLTVAAGVTIVVVLLSAFVFLYDVEIAGKSPFSMLALIIAPFWACLIALLAFAVAEKLSALLRGKIGRAE